MTSSWSARDPDTPFLAVAVFVLALASYLNITNELGLTCQGQTVETWDILPKATVCRWTAKGASAIDAGVPRLVEVGRRERV